MDFTINTEQQRSLSYKTIQTSTLLQMTAPQLEQYLNEQAMENPALELISSAPDCAETVSSETYQWISSHDEQNRYLYQQLESQEYDFPEWNIGEPSSETLSEHLWSQLLTLNWPPEQEEALRFLLNSLDENGYFLDSLEDFANFFRLKLFQAEALLTLIQSLDPPGIGARNLEECLCIQLKRMGALTEELKEFLHSNLSLIAQNQLASISRKEKLPLQTVKMWCELIKQLNPKPGAVFGVPEKSGYVIPDVIAVQEHDNVYLRLNESIYPEIEINNYYMQLFQKTTDKEIKDYLQQKIHQVQWLQQCVQQRDATLLSVAKAIQTLQQEFFLLGPDYLKPLKQADVAAYLNIHVSTVSRACRQKYLQCFWGIFPLTSFFVQAAPSRNINNASSISKTSLNVRKALVELIEHEDKFKPYSDRILAELLASHGFSISRRTVAKYREALSIPSATHRKKY